MDNEKIWECQKKMSLKGFTNDKENMDKNKMKGKNFKKY